MTKKKVDFIILGGGCSALSLINNVIKKKITNYTFLIIEKRKKYTDDKSWGFWDKNDSKYTEFTENSWYNFSFSDKKNNNILTSNIYKYFYIRSSVFYKNSLRAISKSKNVILKLNESILKVKEHNTNYLVLTNKGEYLAKNILDTRNNIDNFQKDTLIYQCFVGYEVKLEGVNKYIPNQAHLMHDMKANKDFFFFDYILPFKPNQILYEFTAFSKKKLHKNYLENKLKSKLKNNSIKIKKILKKEFGVIPMGFINKKMLPKKNNYFYAGTSAGASRPSSGYAFYRIQQWAETASTNIKRKGVLISHPQERFLTLFLDKIFLKVISNYPKLTPEIFSCFTRNITTDSFVRFMSGMANIMDYIKVILAMPKYLLIKCLLKK
jgi:lycopene beta-cyclase